MRTRIDRRAGRARRGQSILEFAIGLPFLTLMTVGTFALGVVIDRHLTVSQLTRNAGNMYGRGVNFSQTSNQTLLLQGATGMQMTTTGGKGVIYLSTVIQAPTGTGKVNAGKAVVIHRIKIGNSSIGPSAVATPTSVASNGDVNSYEDDVAARAVMPAGITVGVNEKYFLAEVLHTPTEIAFPGFFAPSLLYSRAVF